MPTLADVTTALGFEPGRSALLAIDDDDADARRLLVDLVQEGQVTLAASEGERLPRAWRDRAELRCTYLDRFSISTVAVPILRVGETRLVIGDAAPGAPVQRRQYVRVCTPVPASCLLLDPRAASFSPFEGTVHDLGGGGLAMRAGAIAPAGATVVLALALPGEAPVVTVGTVLPDGAAPSIERTAVRVEYTLIKEADRDRLIRFILTSLVRGRPDAPPGGARRDRGGAPRR